MYCLNTLSFKNIHHFSLGDPNMTTTTNIPELRQEVLDIADILRKDIKVESGTLTTSKDIFKTALPENITIEQVKAVNTHMQNFAAAQGLVAGELAVDVFKEDTAKKEVELTVHYPQGKSVAIVQREVTSRNPRTNEETVKYAHVTVRNTVKIPGSQVLAMRSRVYELAKKAGLGE